MAVETTATADDGFAGFSDAAGWVGSFSAGFSPAVGNPSGLSAGLGWEEVAEAVATGLVSGSGVAGFGFAGFAGSSFSEAGTRSAMVAGLPESDALAEADWTLDLEEPVAEAPEPPSVGFFASTCAGAADVCASSVATTPAFTAAGATTTVAAAASGVLLGVGAMAAGDWAVGVGVGAEAPFDASVRGAGGCTAAAGG